MNWQELYEQKVIELEDMRRRAVVAQSAALALIMQSGGEAFVENDTFDRVNEEASGWRSEENDTGVWFHIVNKTSE